jgi:hypothetical protein
MISQEQLAEISRFVEAKGISEVTVSGLRAQYPGMHFTYCMDDDVVEVDPVQERESFNVYLVDARQHCLRLTNDPDVATGLVLAEIVE